MFRGKVFVHLVYVDDSSDADYCVMGAAILQEGDFTTLEGWLGATVEHFVPDDSVEGAVDQPRLRGGETEVGRGKARAANASATAVVEGDGSCRPHVECVELDVVDDEIDGVAQIVEHCGGDPGRALTIRDELSQTIGSDYQKGE